MKRLLASCMILGCIGYAHAQTNLLFNGDFQLHTPANFYFDGDDPGTGADVPGWEAFAVGDSSSWVLVALDTNTFNSDLNLSGSDFSAADYVGLAGMRTAASNLVAVTAGSSYYATVTYDNYSTPAGISYFIDWFDAGGAALNSSGGALGDPNGAGLPFEPFTQRLAIAGIAPPNAASAGVRFASANGDFAGATADNFELVVPLLGPNLLFNGNFQLHTPANFYFDGDNPGTGADVPGWEAFAVGDSSAWVLVALDTNTFNSDLNLSGSDFSATNYVGLAGIRTATSILVAVTAGSGYYATATYDNYSTPAGISYFIDWFDAGGAALNSSGGALGDPNGPGLPFEPFTQRLAIAGIAPPNAASAGVRFASANGDFAGATADNFQLHRVLAQAAPEAVLTIARSGLNVTISWSNGPGLTLQQAASLSGALVWTDVGTQSPHTIPIGSGNGFFRLVGP